MCTLGVSTFLLIMNNYLYVCLRSTSDIHLVCIGNNIHVTTHFKLHTTAMCTYFKNIVMHHYNNEDACLDVRTERVIGG